MNYDIFYLFIIQNYLLKLALYFQEFIALPGSLALVMKPG